MNARLLFATTLVTLFLAACASPSSRIDNSKAAYDSYPPEVRSRIAAGQVDVGFTQEQALLALGEPSRKFTRTTERGASEVWAYEKSASNFSFGVGSGFGIGRSGFGGVGVATGTGDNNTQDKLRLVFENGKISSIEQAVK